MTKKYWTNRQLQAEAARARQNEKFLTELNNAYHLMINDIDKEIAQRIAKISDINGISYTKAKRMLSKGEYKMALDDFTRKAEAAGLLDDALQKELELASQRWHISRLQEMNAAIRRETKLFYKHADKELSNHLSGQLTTGYNAMVKGLKKLGASGSAAGLTQRRVEVIIKKPWASDGKNFSERLWGDQERLTNILQQELTRDVMMGRGPDETIKALKKLYPYAGGKEKRAYGTLVMTESNFIATMADKMAYADSGLEEYEILATLDSKTSEICQYMDGKHFPVKDMEIGVNAPPFHPRCRTTTVPWFADFLDDEERAQRDPVTGKTSMTKAKTYQQWVKSDPFSPVSLDGMLDNVIIRKTNTSEQRLEIAKTVTLNYGGDIDGVSFVALPKSKMQGAWGYCATKPKTPDISNYIELALIKTDRRPQRYRVKTAFHEAYHLANNRRATDFYENPQAWLDMEETFAEASSHYLVKQAGITESMAPSYPDKLVRVLPRLKQLDRYKDCSTLADFGKIAVEDRVRGVPAVWAGMHKGMSEVVIADDYLIHYVDFIKSNKEEIYQAFVDSSPIRLEPEIKPHIMAELEGSLAIIESGEDITNADTNTQIVFNHAIAYAFTKMGVI